MYHREIETIRNRIHDEMPDAVKALPGDKLDRLMEQYHDQMNVEVSTAIHRNRVLLESLPYLEKAQEMSAIARKTREVAQNQFLQEIRAKYQPITE